MFKKLLTILLLYCATSTLVAQQTGCVNFLNERSFFHKLDSDFLEYTVPALKIKTITETYFDYGPEGGDCIDSIMLNRYYFNDSGNLIEKQFNFHSDEIFFSTKYVYEDNLLRDSIEMPWSIYPLVLDGVYIISPESECFTYDENRRLIFEEMVDGDRRVTIKYLYEDKLITKVEVDNSGTETLIKIKYEYFK